MEKSVALLLVKSHSRRLPNKNTLPFHGEPMFVENLRKCKQIFNKVYVSSNSFKILWKAFREGAIPIYRSKSYCGEMPNIPVYQHALKRMNTNAIVAVQANSPNVDIEIIKECKKFLDNGGTEVITCHPDQSIYGSVWGIKSDRIRNYINPYKPSAEYTIVDTSEDIHTKEDYLQALKFNSII